VPLKQAAGSFYERPAIAILVTAGTISCSQMAKASGS
jgi:hypothetical protein